MPESSAIAGRPVAAAAARALPSALSANVVPVSGGSSTSSGSGSSSCGRSSSASSRSLCSLRVASDEPHGVSRPRPPPTASSWAARSRSMPAAGEREQLVERGARERGALGGRLHLDQPAVAGHHHVGVDLGAWSPPSSRGRAARAPSTMPHETAATDWVSGSASSLPSATSRAQRQLERHEAAGDRGAARAAVGLEHVAVDPDRALAERLEVDHAAQRAADQALDLDGAAVGAALRDVARASARPWTRAASRTRP